MAFYRSLVGDVYSVPISFGYDGNRLFLFLIQFGDDSEKLNFADADGTVSLTVYDVERLELDIKTMTGHKGEGYQ